MRQERPKSFEITVNGREREELTQMTNSRTLAHEILRRHR